MLRRRSKFLFFFNLEFLWRQSRHLKPIRKWWYCKDMRANGEFYLTSGSFLRKATSNLASSVFSHTIFPSREANTTPPALLYIHKCHLVLEFWFFCSFLCFGLTKLTRKEHEDHHLKEQEEGKRPCRQWSQEHEPLLSRNIPHSHHPA